MHMLKQRAIAVAGAIALGGLGMGAAMAADIPAQPGPPVYHGGYAPGPVEPAYPYPPPPVVYGYPPAYYGYAPRVVVVPPPFYPRRYAAYPYYPRYYGPRVYAPYYARRYGYY